MFWLSVFFCIYIHGLGFGFKFKKGQGDLMENENDKKLREDVTKFGYVPRWPFFLFPLFNFIDFVDVAVFLNLVILV